MQTIDVGGVRIGYVRTGHGPPVVLLHGYVGDGPTTWRRQLEGLADDFTLIAWDGAWRRSIIRSARVLLPGTGHLCNIEASHEFNSASARGFLRGCS